VLGNASLVLQDSSLDTPTRVKVEQIELAATRAAELTKQMLAYSGKGRFVVRRLDVRLVVAEMQDLLVASIPKGAILENHLPDDLPPVEADAAQIRQVLMNLIVNGAEALEGSPGVVSIHGRAVYADRELLDRYRCGEGAPEGDYVAIEVSDTGCGMDPDTLERIFDPFFTTKFTGRGLGLAAVLEIVRGHYGAVQIYSEPGRGTTFKLLLPAGTSPAVQETVAPESSWRGEGTVLVADDESVVRNLVVATLERAGFTVEAVEDGAAAVAAVSHRPDSFFRLVLLDLMMPGMGGETAFAHIRRLRPELPVMMMSGYNEQDVSNQFAGQGFASFVQKPFRPAELVAKLRSVLEPVADGA